MSKTVVLAEKPSVGRDLARVLGCKQKGNGYIEGNKYIVTWALGHLITLADPDVYDKKYKSWDMADLPMLPKRMKLVIIKKTGKQYNSVKSVLNRNDVKDIVIATDAGREGELVARWIIEKSGVKKPLKRLWISSQTDKAIKDGFKNLKDAKEYENLYKSAVCRSEADWLVGLNVTRALTCKYNAQLSAGRVQTPTLGMIIQREKEIQTFVPKDYYTVTASGKGAQLQWRDNKGNVRTFSRDKAEKISGKISNAEGKVTKVKKALKKKYAANLYDLTELQRDANKRYGYSAKQTLSIMQRLYENYKVLTYPRTDSKYISTDIVPTLYDRVKAVSTGNHTKWAENVLRTGMKINKSFVNNAKVSDHHAIIPTEQKGMISQLSREEKHIYDMVVKRFLAAFYPPYEYEQTSIEIEVNGEVLAAKGNVTKSKGWKMVYSDVDELEDETPAEDTVSNKELPVFTEGESVSIRNSKVNNGKTKPPARFTEAMLLSAMENPQKYLQSSNKELAKTLGETGGLGTVATRADIIEKLYNTFYIEKKGKEIIPTSKGKQLIDLVPSDLKSPILTAEWEMQLSAISKGKMSGNKFISKMREYATKLVGDVKGSSEKYVHDNMTRAKCPECGKYLLEVKGKKGKMLVCQDRECGYRKGVARVTNARCPECHKKLELRGQGDGQIFVCPNCSYREKMSSFQKRKQENNNKVSKRDVNKYLKKQKQEDDEPMNSAFADALSKLKLK